MQKTLFSAKAAGVAAIGFLLAFSIALAATPTLSLSSSGNNLVQASVSGDPNSSVVLYYNVGSFSGTQSLNLGSTNSIGNLTVNVNALNGMSGYSVYVLVNGQQSIMQAWPSTSGTGQLSFSNSNPSISAGQIANITISGGTGYYVSSNTNPNAASHSLSGNTLTISGLQNGNTTITVCSASNGCNPMYVTVGGNYYGGQITFSAANPTLSIGQSSSVYLSGSSNYYISSNSNSNVVQASVSGNILNLYGQNSGSASITVCASTGNCNTLYVAVSGYGYYNQGNASTILSAIQSMQTQLAQILSQIQSLITSLNNLSSSLGNAPYNYTGNYNYGFTFTQYMEPGSRGNEVVQLQQYLQQKGFYSEAITGTFGPLTEAAVRSYQSARGLSPTGTVGASTRSLLNAE